MNTEKDKNMPDGIDKNELKRNFIVEKVVGREISRKNAIKHMLLALVSGIIFGLAAAMTVIMVGKAGNMFHRPDKDVNVEGEDVSHDAEEEIPQSAPETEPQSEGQTEPQTEAPTTSPEETAGKVAVYIDGMEYFIDEAEIRRMIDEELNDEDRKKYDLNAVSEEYRAVIKETDKYVVSVNAKTTNQSWFEDTVETSSTFSGIIIAVSPTEILILTTEEAIKKGSAFKVTFYDGTSKEAVVKQTSGHDRIAVIAVSKEGLSADFAKNIKAIKLGDSDKVNIGDTVLAVGAPIGKVRSYEFGQVSYIGRSEITADGRKDVLYSQISANPDKGTYITNIKGELVGIAKGPDEDTSYYGEASAVRIIGIDYLRDIIEHLELGTEVPYLGIKGKSITFDMKYKNFPQGMYVVECVEDSPAYLAGIKKGDIITGVNQSIITDSGSYEYAVRRLKAGDTVKIILKRSSANSEYKELEFVFTVGAR